MTDEELLQKYMDLKKTENDIKEARLNMEVELLERFGDMVDDEKSSKSINIGRYNIKIKRNIRYDLSEEGWNKVAAMPWEDRPIDVKFSYSKGKKLPELLLDIITKETKPTFEVIYK